MQQGYQHHQHPPSYASQITLPPRPHHGPHHQHYTTQSLPNTPRDHRTQGRVSVPKATSSPQNSATSSVSMPKPSKTGEEKLNRCVLGATESHLVKACEAAASNGGDTWASNENLRRGCEEASTVGATRVRIVAVRIAWI